MDILKFISDVGFPIASACISIYFVYLTQKFILETVLTEIKQQIGIITQLEKRITSMSHDILRIDSLVTEALNLPHEPEKAAKLSSSVNLRKD